jgi:hypothetical protein
VAFLQPFNGTGASCATNSRLIPPGGLGEQQVWLDENCGADGWSMTPAGLRGVVNDALTIYFADAALASAFVAG